MPALLGGTGIIGKDIFVKMKAQKSASIQTASGTVVTFPQAEERAFSGLNVYGHSTQSGTPSPENPVPIVSAGSVMTTGAQLVNFNEVTYSRCNLQDAKTGTIKSDIINSYFCSIYIDNLNEYLMENKGEKFCLRVNDNENKKISIVIHGTDESGDKTQESDVNGRFASIVINDDFTSITRLELRFNRMPEAFTDTETIIGGIMFYKGDSDIAFEPYTGGQPAANPYAGEINISVSGGGTQSQTLTLSTPGGLPGIPVDSGGNYTDESGQQWICDEIDLKRGKYVKKVKQVTYDGSDDEIWLITGNGESIRAFTTMTDVINGYGICDKYIYGIPENAVNCFNIANNFLRFNCYQKATTPDEWVLWLQSNPVTVLYALADPIETDLPAEEIAAYKALHTYSPTTTVSNDADAWMKVEYNEFNKRTF